MRSRLLELKIKHIDFFSAKDLVNLKLKYDNMTEMEKIELRKKVLEAYYNHEKSKGNNDAEFFLAMGTSLLLVPAIVGYGLVSGTFAGQDALAMFTMAFGGVLSATCLGLSANALLDRNDKELNKICEKNTDTETKEPDEISKKLDKIKEIVVK